MNGYDKMKKLKDKEHTEAIIKISKVREVFKENKGSYSFKDKVFCIRITSSTHDFYSSSAFPCTKKGKKDLLKMIKEECYL